MRIDIDSPTYSYALFFFTFVPGLFRVSTPNLIPSHSCSLPRRSQFRHIPDSVPFPHAAVPPAHSGLISFCELAYRFVIVSIRLRPIFARAHAAFIAITSLSGSVVVG